MSKDLADDLTSKLKLSVVEFQSIGEQDSQEDRYVSAEFLTAEGLTASFLMVVEGMGKSGAGERAAFLACTIIPSRVLGKVPGTSEISSTLVQAFELANERIYQEAREKQRPVGMGAACTAVVIVGLSLILVHVGDSRAYLLRAGRLHQLSFDHSWAERALRTGSTIEELRNQPNHGEIDRYLGMGPSIEVDTHYWPMGAAERSQQLDSAHEPLQLKPGDRIILCTDGVSDVLDEKQMQEHLLHASAQTAAQTLVEVAEQSARKKGQADNHTAIVLTLPEEPPPPRTLRAPVSGKWVGTLVAVSLLVAFAVGSDTLGQWTRPEKTLVQNRALEPTVVITATQESSSEVPTAAQATRKPQQVAMSTSQPTENASATPKATATFTLTPTGMHISAVTPTPSVVITNTLTTLVTQTSTQTPLVTLIKSPTATPEPIMPGTAPRSETLEPTMPRVTPRPATQVPTPSATPVPTNTPVPTPTNLPTPTNTSAPTYTPRPTQTVTQMPTQLPSPVPTVVEGTQTPHRIK